VGFSSDWCPSVCFELTFIFLHSPSSVSSYLSYQQQQQQQHQQQQQQQQIFHFHSKIDF
jgi:hypothetical protein